MSQPFKIFSFCYQPSLKDLLPESTNWGGCRIQLSKIWVVFFLLGYAKIPKMPKVFKNAKRAPLALPAPLPRPPPVQQVQKQAIRKGAALSSYEREIVRSAVSPHNVSTLEDFLDLTRTNRAFHLVWERLKRERGTTDGNVAKTVRKSMQSLNKSQEKR